ncbi:hypothetical protein CERZMDRAFT_90047 [Cercospora zeae-maydis SCOH1-5]|uniref:Uncharacterized protein n=1 Tax=Cercospora zeae-maydis SCOH1-5 TaxID=717836 RepID=A0A6A6FRJ9_9PEZI|nr:hypothetical protein CERZMDRAFT_90047 [Cercospora zeae-maydis SCOH1-5]
MPFNTRRSVISQRLLHNRSNIVYPQWNHFSNLSAETYYSPLSLPHIPSLSKSPNHNRRFRKTCNKNCRRLRLQSANHIIRSSSCPGLDAQASDVVAFEETDPCACGDSEFFADGD